MFLDLFILLSVHEHSARMDVDAPCAFLLDFLELWLRMAISHQCECWGRLNPGPLKDQQEPLTTDCLFSPPLLNV